MKKGFFVKYSGLNASIRRNGQYTNAYTFKPGVWTPVHELDFGWYKKKSRKNSTWEVREGQVEEIETKYFAKFLGLPKQKKMEVERYDQDMYGVKIDKTERKYVFPKDEWVEIQQIDAAFFLKKATNDFWLYEKRILTEGKMIETMREEIVKKEEETLVETSEDDE